MGGGAGARRVSALVGAALLVLAAFLTLSAVWGYGRARHDLGTTMGEEMAFGSRWTMGAVFGAAGLLEWLPWWACLAVGVVWYLAGRPVRWVVGVAGEASGEG